MSRRPQRAWAEMKRKQDLATHKSVRLVRSKPLFTVAPAEAEETDVIKTLHSSLPTRHAHEMIYGNPYLEYYFTLGKGKPGKKLRRMWFTYKGRIVGSFKIDRVIVNDGSFPELSSLEGGGWAIKPDRWVAICKGPCVPLKERLFMPGFRGWRYFNLDEYRGTAFAKVRL